MGRRSKPKRFRTVLPDDQREAARSADLRHRMATDEATGLVLPEAAALERAEAQRMEDAQAEIERRRKGRRDKLIRRDGRIRKGSHTQSRQRAGYNRRKRGFKGIVGG